MKLITILLLIISALSEDLINGNYMTYTGPTLKYCEVLSANYTLSIAMTEIMLSLGGTNVSTYFGGSLRVIFNQMTIPGISTAYWIFEGVSRLYTSQGNINVAPIPTSSPWIINANVANAARVLPIDPVGVFVVLSSVNTGKSMRIKKDLFPVLSTFTITSASISPSIALETSCLTLNFTTNCHKLDSNTQFEFVAPNFNGNNTPIQHMFSDMPNACQNLITFSYKNTPACTVTNDGVVISQMFTAETSNTTFSVQICGVTAPPFGSPYDVSLYLRNSNGMRYASTTFSVSSTEAPQLRVSSTSFNSEIVNADFDLTAQAQLGSTFSYPFNFDMWLDFNDTWKDIAKTTVQFINLTNDTEQYFFNIAPVEKGLFKVTINNKNLDLKKGFKIRVLGINNPSTFGNYKFKVQLKGTNGVPITSPLDIHFSVFEANTPLLGFVFDNTNLNQLTNATVGLKIPYLSLVNKMTSIVFSFGNGAVIKAADFKGIVGIENFSFTNYEISETKNTLKITNFFVDQPPNQSTLSIFKINGIRTSSIDADQVLINAKIYENTTEKLNQNANVDFSKIQFAVKSATVTRSSSTFSLRIDFNYKNPVNFGHNFRIKLPNVLTNIATKACIASSNIPGYNLSSTCKAGLLTAKDTSTSFQSILISNLLSQAIPLTDYFIVIKGNVPTKISSTLPFALDIVSSLDSSYQTNPDISIADIFEESALFSCGSNCNICNFSAATAKCDACNSEYSLTSAGTCIAAMQNSAVAAPMILLGANMDTRSTDRVLESEKTNYNDDDNSDNRGIKNILSGFIAQLPLIITSIGCSILLNKYIIDVPMSNNIAIWSVMIFSHLSNFTEVLRTLESITDSKNLLPQNSYSVLYQLINLILVLLVLINLKNEIRGADIKSNSLLLTVLTILLGPTIVLAAMLKAQNASNNVGKVLRMLVLGLLVAQIIQLGTLLGSIDVLDISYDIYSRLGVLTMNVSGLIILYQCIDQAGLIVKNGLQMKAGSLGNVETDNLRTSNVNNNESDHEKTK